MFLSDIAALQSVTAQRKQVDPSRYVDQTDLELDRLYAGSPLIADNSSAAFHMVEAETNEANDMLEGGENTKTLENSFFKSVRFIEPLTFEPVRVNLSRKANISSLVTVALIEDRNLIKATKNNVGKLPITIYLPDYNDFQIYVLPSIKMGKMIEQILNEHSEQGLHPPLQYKNASNYELRMHEGDGEPDRDFPAFDREKCVEHFDFDEYCLCEAEDHNSYRTFSVNDSIFSPGFMGSASGKSFDTMGSQKKLGEEPVIQQEYEVCSDNSRQLPMIDNFVTVKFPSGHQLSVPHDDDMTLRQLLSKIAESCRLKLHIDEYEFVISNQDQRSLFYVSPVMDIDAKINSIGTKSFDIMKKFYADSQFVAPKAATNKPSIRVVHPQDRSSFALDNAEGITFTEATANAYQQWNVVKKNKFGIKQERIFGVDGKKVYNAKRGQLRGGNVAGVQRAERDISSIVKIERLNHDEKTFRITWCDNNDIYYIEYTCDTSRECAEIVAKVKFILNRIRLEKR